MGRWVGLGVYLGGSGGGHWPLGGWTLACWWVDVGGSVGGRWRVGGWTVAGRWVDAGWSARGRWRVGLTHLLSSSPPRLASEQGLKKAPTSVPFLTPARGYKRAPTRTFNFGF